MLTDGLSAAGDSRAWVVEGDKLFRNYCGQWLVWATLSKLGLPEGASVDQVLSAKRDYEKSLVDMRDNFYDRCTGTQCNPL